MVRRRASELYQVDFVAALFGGFLLVWLSSIGEAEFPGKGEGKGLALFEVTARAFFKSVDGKSETDVSIIPRASFRAGCAHPNLVTKLELAGLQTFPCSNGVTYPLGADNNRILTTWAEDMA